ncbi:helix-turn-helix transcriptional regulator [Yeguia hominis]|uniref:Helix-turn-helix transcriptional regulator n=1 Tax=Yeguia hominis TaxID=2763662 RepID=A0A926HRT2_9FIRM|nr:helix-turn-helix transcriptional regulator [Yeguia hominis]MBC8533568.1 helix-turn-helix transcriptional regulator [Yeguia hominis]
MDKRYHEMYKKLGLNLAYYRKSKGYTQELLAEKLDVDRTTISKIELAVSGVSLDLLFAISELLEIPVQRFFEFRD